MFMRTRKRVTSIVMRPGITSGLIRKLHNRSLLQLPLPSLLQSNPVLKRERTTEQTHLKNISGVTDLTQEIPTKRPDGR